MDRYDEMARKLLLDLGGVEFITPEDILSVAAFGRECAAQVWEAAADVVVNEAGSAHEQFLEKASALRAPTAKEGK